MNISLTPSLDQFVRAKVEGGSYESASEVVRDSLRAMQLRERQQLSGWGDLDTLVAEARADVAAGRVHDGETLMAGILRELDEEAKPASKRPTSARRNAKAQPSRTRK